LINKLANYSNKTALMKFFIGLGMKETKGKADPKKLEKLLNDGLR